MTPHSQIDGFTRLLMLSLALGLLSFTSNPSSAQPLTLISQLPPPPPPTPPLNTTRSGGSLSISNACAQTNEPVTAIVPVKNPVLTTSEYPTFLFYVPYSSNDVRFGEFSILTWPNEMTRLYHTRFTLPETPGIVSISVPALPKYALAENLSYHWYFKLHCKDSTASSTDIKVDGWVQRVKMNAARERAISAYSPEIWYDALAQLDSRLRTSPQNSELRNYWRNLLNSIYSGDLTKKPLVGPVQLLQKEHGG